MPVAIVVAIGLLFSFWPFFLWQAETGHFVYIADADNQYYLLLASRMYFGNPFAVQDVAVPHGATMYQVLQLLPAVLIARTFGLSVFSINLLWHLWAAVAMPLGFYLVFRRLRQTRWTSAVCTILMLTDCGLRAAPVLTQVAYLYRTFAGHLPTLFDGQDLLQQWRILNPSVTLPVLLAQIVFVISAAECPKSRTTAIIAGLATGVLFYTFFYYWTAAVLGLSLAIVFDRFRRSMYIRILATGILTGTGAIVAGLLTKARFAPDALSRTGFMAHVPRFAFFLIPKVALLELLFAGMWLWPRRRHGYLYLWCLAVAGIALANSHIVTGLDLRPGHWEYVWATATRILVLGMLGAFLARRVTWSRPAAIVLTACVLVEIGAGLILRTAEVRYSIEQVSILTAFKEYVTQFDIRRRMFPPDALIAGDKEFCDLSGIASGALPLAGYATFLSPDLNDQAVARREALNARLMGMSERSFRTVAEAAGRDYAWGQAPDQQRRAHLVTAAMMREFARVGANPEQEIDDLGVAYVALPAAHAIPAYLNRGWTLIQAGPYWQIWRRNTN